MRVFKHEGHNAYEINKRLVVIKKKGKNKIKFFFPDAIKHVGLLKSIVNFKFYISPHKELRYWHWLIRLPLFYWSKSNGGFEIGFPNLYLRIIR